MSAFISPFHSIRLVFTRNSAKSHKKRRTIQKFVDKVGLIYFGLVDQHKDEHRIIRGLTVSSTHRDDDYSVGSIEGYDVSLVNRQDIKIDDNKSVTTHDWILLEIQLNNQTDLPHMFIEAKSTVNNSLIDTLTLSTALKEVTVGTLEAYPIDFTSRYSIHSSPGDAVEAQRLVPSSVARAIGTHFWPLSIEVLGNSIIIYSYKESVTNHLLNMMITDGIWLAKSLDSSLFS